MKIHTATCEWCEGKGGEYKFGNGISSDRRDAAETYRECVICHGEGTIPVKLVTRLSSGFTVETELIKGRWHTNSIHSFDRIQDRFWGWTADDNLEDAKRRHNQAIGHVG